MNIKVMIVVGARPNFMKAAPLIRALRGYHNSVTRDPASASRTTVSAGIQVVLVHTGQHYDSVMSDSFFADLSLPAPDIHLAVGSGSHASQTAEIMTRFESALLREMPDVLVVVGDVNSTLACGLAAAKICSDVPGTRPIIAHVEAGLRSFDRSMPEEINRILTDHLSDLLFVSEDSGLRNLASEGIPAEKIHFVGNTMIDSLLASRDRARASRILDVLGLTRGGNGSVSPVAPYALLTIHRPANVDDRGSLLSILDGLDEVARECAVIFPAHPRTRNRVREFGLEDRFEWGSQGRDSNGWDRAGQRGLIRLIEPLGYLDFLRLMMEARLVVTDSGGIQEETTCLGVPCVTVRSNTERPVTVETGTNVLAGTSEEGIRNAIRRQLKSSSHHCLPEGWDGKAAIRIVDVLLRTCEDRRSIELRPVRQPPNPPLQTASQVAP
jgi:UDP-N-acetylglucosamine 2-epimerase (non-hydrolysing)